MSSAEQLAEAIVHRLLVTEAIRKTHLPLCLDWDKFLHQVRADIREVIEARDRGRK